MSEFILRPIARSDLANIWQYTSENWNVEQADYYIRELNGGFQLLANMPNIGQDYSDVREGYRKYKVQQHLIFYRSISDDLIEIVRVLHERMDFDSHLSE